MGSRIAAPAFDRLPCADVGIEEGKPFQVGGITLQPLHTPGHTDGHFAYLFDDRETATDKGRLVKDSGMAYVNIPVDKAALSERQIEQLDESLRANHGSYLLHCASGARAAMLLSLNRARQHGWTAERTFQEAEAMGFDLRSSSEMAAFVRQVRGK